MGQTFIGAPTLERLYLSAFECFNLWLLLESPSQHTTINPICQAPPSPMATTYTQSNNCDDSRNPSYWTDEDDHNGVKSPSRDHNEDIDSIDSEQIRYDIKPEANQSRVNSAFYGTTMSG